jgi:hypothetical protein
MEQAHIQKSVYCDFDHPAVSGLARDLANDAPDPLRVTLSTFKYIRDNIRFGFDLVQVKASQTLEKRNSAIIEYVISHGGFRAAIDGSRKDRFRLSEPTFQGWAWHLSTLTCAKSV